MASPTITRKETRSSATSCHTRAGEGPGTPFFTDAPAGLGAALEEFDFAGGNEPALRRVLESARPRDTLTLWHLLSQVEPEERLRVFNRMVELAPLPQGISREKVLDLDRDTLNSWRQELAWKW